MATITIPAVIIGGGIAGLYLSTRLPCPCLLVEASASLGGRIRTSYDEDRVTLEQGPWRVHESHSRFLALIAEAGLHVDPTSSSSLSGGYSTFDKIVLEKGIEAAREADIRSGYVGLSNATAAANVYHAQRHQDGTYFTVREGLSKVVEFLEDISPADIWINTKVYNVQRKKHRYIISAKRRVEKDRFESIVVCTSSVFFCVPPHVTKQWDVVDKYLRPQIHAVQSHPLHHIYVAGRLAKNTHRKIPSVLSQIISGDYEKKYFQASYSAGRVATFWQRLKLNDPALFRSFLLKELRREGIVIEKNNVDIKSFYWEHAVHYWIPLYGSPSVQKLVEQGVEPHPLYLPNLYWCGEAFSGYQGWIEGALQTADMVLQRVMQPSPFLKTYPREFVVMDGRVIDVEKWKHVHPGSEKAIAKRLGKDISEIFRHINHTTVSWATLYGLQVGFSSRKIKGGGTMKNIYGQPLEPCKTKHDRPGGSWDRDGKCSDRQDDTGKHQICLAPIPRNFSSKTNQSSWSEDREDSSHCVCIGAYSMYHEKDPTVKKHLNCNAIPETALQTKSHYRSWNREKIKKHKAARESICNQCVARVTGESATYLQHLCKS